MSDRPKDSLSLDLRAPWRDSFLARFTRPGDAEALARVGDLLLTFALEHGHH